MIGFEKHPLRDTTRPGRRGAFAFLNQWLGVIGLGFGFWLAVPAWGASGSSATEKPKPPAKTRSKAVTPLLPPLTNAAPPSAPPLATNRPPTDPVRAKAPPKPLTAPPKSTSANPRAPSARSANAGSTNAVPTKARIPEPFARLNYEAVRKPEHPGNPRREVKGLYVTLYSAGSATALAAILDVVDRTAINALVIDVKDDTGRLLHVSKAGEQHNPNANKGAPVKDLAAFVKALRDRQVYVIARIVTFKDPTYAETHPARAILVRKTGKLFRSQDGLAWGSPYDPDYRAYNLAVAKEAAQAGFHEIQFDYIRFPEIADDASLDYRNRTRQSKAEAVQSFLLEARAALHPLGAYLSADVFGLVSAARDDMRVGQFWEAISSAVDYISPMAYPSHYAPGSYGLAAPDLQPYELMFRTTRDALRRNQNIPTPAEVRPWIQGFTASWLPRFKVYGPAEIGAQIRALQDQGVASYLVWNPGNRYRRQQAAFEEPKPKR